MFSMVFFALGFAFYCICVCAEEKGISDSVFLYLNLGNYDYEEFATIARVEG